MRKPKVPQATIDQLGVVAGERAKQDARWGEQNHPLEWWVCILGEEFGELAQAVLETQFGGPKGGLRQCYTEAKQVAAVAVAIMEYIKRYCPEASTTAALSLPVDVPAPSVPMPLRLKELADAFALIYSEVVRAEYVPTAGDRAGARAVLTAADGDADRARAWMRWYLHDDWYRRNCPTLASMGKQINAVRAKAESTSGGMTDELWKKGGT